MYNICLLTNENPYDHGQWLHSLAKSTRIKAYDAISLASHDWLEKIKRKEYHLFLAKPPGMTAFYKQLYDERIYIIDQVLKAPLYPRAQEIFIYENKRFFYSWLEANNLPHPGTHVFFSRSEAETFAAQADYPLVAKVNIGASGSGVSILKDNIQALKYIEHSFSSKGAPRRWGPNLSKGNLLGRGFHYVLNPGDIRKKIYKYSTVRADRQKNFVIFQEFIAHDFEWRIVAIGGSYFAHKKLKIGEKASGSTLKQYDNPPARLFDFARGIMDRFGFVSQAIDVFETNEGQPLINEMQCIFGQSDPYLMLVDGKPGRYVFQDGNWVFEEGDFNTNESFDLRLENALDLYEKGRL